MTLNRREIDELMVLAAKRRDKAINLVNSKYKKDIQSIKFLTAMEQSPVLSCVGCKHENNCNFPIRKFNVGCPSIAALKKTKKINKERK